MSPARELRSHVRRRHVRAATRMSYSEVFPCAAMFELMRGGPLHALLADHHGNRDQRNDRRTSAAGAP
jgi:hypothetical protein